jgi:hypothetical protein
MVMLPRKLEREYQAIKALLCEGKIAIPSQIVVAYSSLLFKF